LNENIINFNNNFKKFSNFTELLSIKTEEQSNDIFYFVLIKWERKIYLLLFEILNI
jgi:hypothetical protein